MNNSLEIQVNAQALRRGIIPRINIAMSGSDMLALGKTSVMSQAVIKTQIPKDLRFPPWQCNTELNRQLYLPMVIQIYNPRESKIRRHAM
jgi:hypothetical protein